MLTQIDLTNIISWFESNDVTMKDFKCKVELWMLTSDNVGNVSYRSRSVKSSSSKKSSVSSSVRSARLRELQRQAELSARVDGLKKKQQLQFSQLKLKQEEEELALSTELAVSAAINQVLDQYEDQEDARYSEQPYAPKKTISFVQEPVSSHIEHQSPPITVLNPVQSKLPQTVPATVHKYVQEHRPHENRPQDMTHDLPKPSYISRGEHATSVLQAGVDFEVHQTREPVTTVFKNSSDIGVTDLAPHTKPISLAEAVSAPAILSSSYLTR